MKERFNLEKIINTIIQFPYDSWVKVLLFRTSQVALVVENSPNRERSMSRLYIVTLLI